MPQTRDYVPLVADVYTPRPGKLRGLKFAGHGRGLHPMTPFEGDFDEPSSVNLSQFIPSLIVQVDQKVSNTAEANLVNSQTATTAIDFLDEVKGEGISTAAKLDLCMKDSPVTNQDQADEVLDIDTDYFQQKKSTKLEEPITLAGATAGVELKFDPSSLQCHINPVDLSAGPQTSSTFAWRPGLNFEKLREKMTDITPQGIAARGFPEGFVLKRLIKGGTGDDELLDSSIVTFHYTFTVEGQDESFDCTKIFNRVKRCRIDATLFGLQVALKSMRRGETAQFLLSPGYAFGSRGVPPRVPPDAEIVAEIELLSWEEGSDDELDYFMQALEDRNAPTPTFDKVLRCAKRRREYIKKFAKLEMWGAAANRYRRVIELLEAYYPPDKPSLNERLDELVALHRNSTLCYYHLGRYKVALESIEMIRTLKPVDCGCKVHYWSAKCLFAMGECEKAHVDARMAQMLRPQDTDVSQLLADIEAGIRQYKEKSKQQAARMVLAKSSSKTKDDNSGSSSAIQIKEISTVSQPQKERTFEEARELLLKDFAGSSDPHSLSETEQTEAYLKALKYANEHGLDLNSG